MRVHHMHPRQRPRVWQFGAGLCALALLAALLAPLQLRAQAGGGQEFEELPFPAGHNAASIKRLQAQIGPICRAGVFADPEEQGYIDTYVAGLAAELTMKEYRVLPPGRSQRGLVNIRQELRITLVFPSSRAARQDVHDFVNQSLLKHMTPIVENPKFHYGARANAMCVIADLNQREAPAFGNGDPAIPFAPALPILMKMAGDAQQDAAVRVPALRGVVRHIEWNNPSSIAQGLRPGVVALLVAIAKEKPVEGMSSDGQKYRQAFALQGLLTAAMNWREANTPEVVGVAYDVASDPKAWLDSRVMAANVIGRLPSNVFDQSQIPAMVRTLGDLAVAVTSPDSGPLKAFGASALAPPPTAILVEAIQFYLEGIKMGLGAGSGSGRGLYGQADANTKKLIEEVLKKVEDMLAIAATPRITAGELSSKISAKRQELVQMLGQGAAGTAADTRARPMGAGDGANRTTTSLELSDASNGAK